MIFCYTDLIINPLPEIMNLTHKIRKRYFKKLPMGWKLLTLFFACAVGLSPKEKGRKMPIL